MTLNDLDKLLHLIKNIQGTEAGIDFRDDLIEGLKIVEKEINLKTMDPRLPKPEHSGFCDIWEENGKCDCFAKDNFNE